MYSLLNADGSGLLLEGVLHNVSQKKLRKAPKTHEPWKNVRIILLLCRIRQ
jgi:hypothetical protein